MRPRPGAQEIWEGGWECFGQAGGRRGSQGSLGSVPALYSIGAFRPSGGAGGEEVKGDGGEAGERKQRCRAEQALPEERRRCSGSIMLPWFLQRVKNIRACTCLVTPQHTSNPNLALAGNHLRPVGLGVGQTHCFGAWSDGDVGCKLQNRPLKRHLTDRAGHVFPLGAFATNPGGRAEPTSQPVGRDTNSTDRGGDGGGVPPCFKTIQAIVKPCKLNSAT